jgi:pimeloyl-ACP methyl ester carboxylesterase
MSSRAGLRQSMNEDLANEWIEVNGIRLHVVLAGELTAPPVLLLHGFPEFWYGWRHQIRALTDAGFRLILPDQRGYNLSDKPRGVSAYSVEALLGDLWALMDHYGYEQVNLIGHDWGAALAWMAAMVDPRRIRRLSILNVPHPAVMMKFLTKSPAQMIKSWYIAFFQIPALAEFLLQMGDCVALTRLLAWSGKPDTFTPQDLAMYRTAWSQPGAVAAMINWYRALLRYRLEIPEDCRIQPPTLLLWGQKDIALSAAMAQPSFDLCEQGRLRIFANASHWLQHDEPAEVNQELIRFLRSDEPSG